jgi:hypothetical protein
MRRNSQGAQVKTIFLDECGYTGEDLADPAQPTFAVATHGIPEARCIELKREFFNHVQAPELKHMKLQGRARNEPAIIAFLRYALGANSEVRFGIMHKPFALVMKMVDMLTEEMMYRDGLDLYERGGHIALSRLIFYTLQAEGPGFLNNVTRLFQKALRTRTPAALQEFDDFISRPHPIQMVEESLDYLRLPLRRLPREHLLKFPPNALDLSMTTGLQCMYAWKRAGVGEMKVIHDASSNMAKRKAFWDAILSPNAPPAFVGNADDAVMFPIGVKETVFANSKDHVGLQLADVIVGASARWTKWLANGRPDGDQYAKHLDTIFADALECVACFLWPIRDVSPIEGESGGVNPLDYITSVIAPVAAKNEKG